MSTRVATPEGGPDRGGGPVIVVARRMPMRRGSNDDLIDSMRGAATPHPSGRTCSSTRVCAATPDASRENASYAAHVSTLALVCPPLETWLPRRVLGERGRARARLLPVVEPKGELRQILVDLPDVDMPLPGLSHTASGLEVTDRLDALVIVTHAKGPLAGGIDALPWVRPGGLVVEIIAIAPHWLPWIVGLPSSVGLHRELVRASRRATQWSMMGLFDVEQWLCRDPGDYVVTLGRVRCPPPPAPEIESASEAADPLNRD